MEDSKYFCFLFFIFFSFIFIFERLRIRVNVTSMSHCHTIMCHIEEHRRFWKDDVIQHVLHILILR